MASLNYTSLQCTKSQCSLHPPSALPRLPIVHPLVLIFNPSLPHSLILPLSLTLSLHPSLSHSLTFPPFLSHSFPPCLPPILYLSFLPSPRLNSPPLPLSYLPSHQPTSSLNAAIRFYSCSQKVFYMMCSMSHSS